MIGLFHFLLIFVAWASPWLVPWWMIVIGVGVLSVQYAACGGCVLTHTQFGKIPYDTFYYHYLVRIFPLISRKAVWLTVRFFVPVFLLALAWLLQIEYDFVPFLQRLL
jgi:hypothetical protein